LEVEAMWAGVLRAAERHGWQVEVLPAGAGVELLALRRCVARPERRVYLSAGLHGDEPAGPLALWRRLEADAWPLGVDLYVCPCLNPTGLRLNQRESAAGVDLNRDYRDGRAPEVRAHRTWLESQPRFDLAVGLHEDWEARGFYLYELNPAGGASCAEAVVAEVGRWCPIDGSELIDGREAVGGIIRPRVDPAQRPDWPEALYLVERKTGHSLTLEAPSDFEMEVRVGALQEALDVVLGAGGPGQASGLC
jgi:predicted deacylase